MNDVNELLIYKCPSAACQRTVYFWYILDKACVYIGGSEVNDIDVYADEIGVHYYNTEWVYFNINGSHYIIKY